jgi:hypothetical protein
MSVLKDRIASMVFAFGDEDRKHAVRLLASDVAAVEQDLAEARNVIDHWKTKATCYGNIVFGCSPVLEAAGFPVDRSMPGGAVRGVAEACKKLADDRDGLREQLAEARRQVVSAPQEAKEAAISKTPMYDKLYREATSESNRNIIWYMNQFHTREEAKQKVMKGVECWAKALYETETRLADALNELAMIKGAKTKEGGGK